MNIMFSSLTIWSVLLETMIPCVDLYFFMALEICFLFFLPIPTSIGTAFLSNDLIMKSTPPFPKAEGSWLLRTYFSDHPPKSAGSCTFSRHSIYYYTGRQPSGTCRWNAIPLIRTSFHSPRSELLKKRCLHRNTFSLTLICGLFLSGPGQTPPG